MWAFLFWTLLVAWFFSTRSNRGDSLDDTHNHGPVQGCTTSSQLPPRPVTCCNGHTCQHNVAPKKTIDSSDVSPLPITQTRETRRPTSGAVSENPSRGLNTSDPIQSTGTASSGSERSLIIKRDLPPHLPKRPLPALSEPIPGKVVPCQTCGVVFPSIRLMKKVSQPRSRSTGRAVGTVPLACHVEIFADAGNSTSDAHIHPSSQRPRALRLSQSYQQRTPTTTTARLAE